MSDHHELAPASMAVGGSVAALRARSIRSTGERAVDVLLATTAMLVFLPLFIVATVRIAFSSIWVSTNPGHIALTLTPSAPASIATHRVSPTSACFDVLYAD